MHRDVFEIYQVEVSKNLKLTKKRCNTITDRQLHPKCIENSLSLSLIVFSSALLSSDRICQPLVFELMPCNFEFVERVEVVYGESTEPGYGMTGYSDPL